MSILLPFFLLPQLFSQELLISGKILDNNTNQILTSVSVYDRTSLRGTITDNSGLFKISLLPGEHNLEFSHTGFEHLDTTLNLVENTEVIIYLTPLTVSVGEVKIFAEVVKDNVTSPLMGSFTIKNKEIMALPSLFGETDPLRILQLTPGVQAGSEGNIGFYVRGGGTDQNLILYDNTILYNPGHLLGFFSVFIPEFIKDVSIIKSGIPAQYGGKISSVIQLNSFKGNKDSTEVMGSVGLIASRISVSGPLFKNNATFILGARRTYLELFIEPLVRAAVTKTSFFRNRSKYNFYDFNAGVSLNIGKHDIISFSGYSGRDNFSMDNTGIKLENSLNWGNTLASMGWNHKLSSAGDWNTNISYTRYSFDLSGSQGSYFFNLLSSIDDYSVKSNISLSINNLHLKTGIELTKHRFIPNKINAKADDYVLNFGQFSAMNALEGAIFADGEYPFSSKLSIAGGLRLSFFNHRGPFKRFENNTLGQITDTVYYPRGESLAFFAFPEPRFVLKYQINSNASIKASYMRIAQYIHLATSATASLPTDIWIPSTTEIKPMIGSQVSLGYFQNFADKNIEFSTELYYKKMNNQLEFLQGIIYNSIDGNMEDNLAAGYGRSYGVEFYLRVKYGKSLGWASYTLSRTEHVFDEINEGYVYPAKYDRRHDISLTFIRKFNDKWSGSAVFVFLSGNAYTLPIGRYIIQGRIVNQYGEVNSFRMPPYHRMDVSLTRKIITGNNWNSELVFSVYNIYSRANPYFIYFEVEGDLEKYTLNVKPVVVSLFPVIPSVSWNFRF